MINDVGNMYLITDYYDDKFDENMKMENQRMSILIKDTTKEERERIVAESIGNISGSCDGCMAGLADMYQDYIDGKKEIRDINMEFNARYISGVDGPEKSDCGYKY